MASGVGTLGGINPPDADHGNKKCREVEKKFLHTTGVKCLGPNRPIEKPDDT